jgi:hypothetical protein
MCMKKLLLVIVAVFMGLFLFAGNVLSKSVEESEKIVIECSNEAMAELVRSQVDSNTTVVVVAPQ